MLQVIDLNQITHQAVEEAVAAFEAQGGAIYLGSEGDPRLVYKTPEWRGEARVSVPLESDVDRYGALTLGARRNGADYTEREREALLRAMEPVARATVLARVDNRGEKLNE